MKCKSHSNFNFFMFSIYFFPLSAWIVKLVDEKQKNEMESDSSEEEIKPSQMRKRSGTVIGGGSIEKKKKKLLMQESQDMIDDVDSDSD